MKHLIFAFLLVLLQPLLLIADTDLVVKPASSQLPLDPDFQPILGTYLYDVFWEGVRVGKATISIDKEEDYYRISVKASSNHKVGFLYKFRYKGEVAVEPYPFKPIKATVEENAGRKKKNIEIQFPETNRADSVEVKKVGNKTKSVTEGSATSDSFLIDPFSAIFLVRHLDWELGMAEVFEVFTGKKKYELKLYCDSVTTKTIAGNSREAWLIIPETTDLSKPNAEKKSEFRIYLSKDEQKEILKIEGAPKIGRVEARARIFPSPK